MLVSYKIQRSSCCILVLEHFIMNTFELSENIKVEVGVFFSKYVKISGYGKSISLVNKAWRMIVNNQALIDKSLEDGSDFGLTFTTAKTIKVGLFRDQPYLTFCKQFEANGQPRTMYISLKKSEWTRLKQNIADIERVLNYDVIACDDNDTWSIHPTVVNNSHKKRLVPRMCQKTFMLQLHTFLVSEEIKRRVKKSCYGCALGSNDPYSHMMNGCGCQADWSSIVNFFYTEIKPATVVANAVDTINSLMTWNVEYQPVPDEMELLQVVIDHKKLSCCSPCSELLPLYWELYKKALM